MVLFICFNICNIIIYVCIYIYNSIQADMAAIRNPSDGQRWDTGSKTRRHDLRQPELDVLLGEY